MQTKNKKMNEGSVNMFGYVAHAIMGLIAAMPMSHVPGDIMLGVLGGLWPDIDHTKSMLGRFNPVARWLTHRGFCHSFTAMLIFSLPFIYVGVLTFSMGFLSHLVMDYIHSWGRWKPKLF